MPFAFHETCTRQDRKMGRERVLRNSQQARKFARRYAIRLMLYQQAERIEARALGESRQRGDGFPIFHISRLMEILKPVNGFQAQPLV
jgi:hypothetical protein